MLKQFSARITATIAAMLLLLTSFASATSGMHCPFCSALNLTFAQQMNKSDIVVIAKVVNIPKPIDDIDAPPPKASFEITQVLKGDRFVKREMTFKSLLIGTYELGDEFLIMGNDPPAVIWEAPLRASERVIDYIGQLSDLPDEGVERLKFFQDYFEDSESLLAFDAYDEFAGAPYEALLELKDHMPREKLLEWIKDSDTAVNRRRLYFVMLGVCGTEDDIEYLEELIKSGDRGKQAGLDSLLACYLNLKKEAGVDLVESTFITDQEVDYVDTLAAVTALRFHGTEVDFIPKERIIKAVRQLLDRPKMADMIIPDLARWKDWTVMDKLVKMFKEADDETNWLRVPVIGYLQECPDPIAKKHIEELRKIDPDAVRRAEFFAEVGNYDSDDGWDKEEDDGWGDEELNSEVDGQEQTPDIPQVKPATEDDSQTYVTLKVVQEDVGSDQTDQAVVAPGQPNEGSAERIPANLPPEIDNQSVETVSGSMATPEPRPIEPKADEETTVAQSTIGSGPVAQSETVSENLTWSIIFIPMVLCGGIFALLWSVINGWFERLIF